MKDTKPADSLSILSLAAAVAGLVSLLFCIIPMFAFCLAPVSAISMAVAVVSALASLVRTTLKPELEGRGQALTALGIAAVWGLGAWVLYQFALRHS